MIISMFSGFFLVKAANKSRKRDYIAAKAQTEDGGGLLANADKPRLQSLSTAGGARSVSPIESLLQNLSRQWDKK